MRRPVSGSGRLAPLDGGSSRRSGVMRLCSSEQPAHISLIRRRSRSIVSRAPASSGNRPCRPERYSDVSIDQEIEGAVTNHLTAGPSISATFRCRKGHRDRPRMRDEVPGQDRGAHFRALSLHCVHCVDPRADPVHGPARPSTSRLLAMTPSPTQRCIPLSPRYRQRRRP